MTSKWVLFSGAAVALIIAFFANIIFGAHSVSPSIVFDAAFNFDVQNYDHHIVLSQRLPRALIAIYVGAVMACGGAVLQGLLRNPLASPALLGINAGATFFVIAAAFFFGASLIWQGILAIIGGLVGFLLSLAVARMAGFAHRLAIILAGAVVSMFFMGLSNALLLSDPMKRSDFLNWITGNINHVYFERLEMFWLSGLMALGVLFFLARPLTLITLGEDKAASVGVNVSRVSFVAILAVALSSSTAVAVCGPVGFVGLITPHIARPLIGSSFTKLLPACALVGATTCLIADLMARVLFAPYVLHTGVMMDLIGGIAFIMIVKRFYLQPERARSA